MGWVPQGDQVGGPGSGALWALEAGAGGKLNEESCEDANVLLFRDACSGALDAGAAKAGDQDSAVLRNEAVIEGEVSVCGEAELECFLQGCGQVCDDV
mgnify:CR=1 FL=1